MLKPVVRKFQLLVLGPTVAALLVTPLELKALTVGANLLPTADQGPYGLQWQQRHQ
jgi:hypothetical protein